MMKLANVKGNEFLNNHELTVEYTVHEFWKENQRSWSVISNPTESIFIKLCEYFLWRIQINNEIIIKEK